MNFKKIYGLILGVIAAGLTSCSSDLNNEEKAPVGPNETAVRSLSIATGDVKTRSEVNIDAGNKWVTGDKFMAFNRTFTGSSSESRYGVLTASGTGTRTTLDGVIACKNGDELGIFYPGSYVTGFDQGKMSVVMTKSYINSDKGQDGSKENLKYFDYSFGKGTVTVNGTSASGSVDMKKLYSILELDFAVGGTKLTNIKKLVLSNVYTEAVYNIPNDKLEDYETGAIEVNSPVALKKVYVAILPQNHFSPTFEVYTTDNKSYRFAVSTPNFNLVAAKVYPFTVQVQEFTPEPVTPPYIEIGGVKWGKYNLQYSPGTHTDGWKDGYHLAKNPWDYFYTAKCAYPLTQSALDDRVTTLGEEWDHFRWGDIVKAHDYSVASGGNYSLWTIAGDINGQFNSNKTLGDLAAYASDGKWQMPTAQQFSDMMSKTAESIGYFVDDNGNTIYGVLFDPNVPDSKKGKILDKDGNIHTSSNTLTVFNRDQLLRKFTKADFENALFFPMAGMYNDYGSSHLSKPGSQGAYWLATGGNATTAAAFVPYVSAINEIFAGYTKSAKNPKRAMYSIRPIYVGQ